MHYSDNRDYYSAIHEILANSEVIKLHPDLKQCVTDQSGDSIGFKIQHKNDPLLTASVVLYSTAFDLVDGSERLTWVAKERSRVDIKVLCDTWSRHERIEVR